MPTDPSPGALQAAVEGGTLIDAELLPFYLRAAAACAVGEFDVEPSCPEYQRYATARRRAAPRPNLAQFFGAVGRQHLRHPEPVVRMLAGQLAVADLGPSLEPLLQAIEAETQPLVARAWIRLVMHAGRSQPQAWLVLPDAATPTSACSERWGEKPCRRKDLAQWASWWWARAAGPDQLLVRAEAVTQWAEALATAAEGDLAPERLAAACAQLSGSLTATIGEERGWLCGAVALACPAAVAPWIRTQDLPAQVVEQCVGGALQSWCRTPAYDTANPAGYGLVLQELRRLPRDEQRPSWRWIQSLACAKPLIQADPTQGGLVSSWCSRAGFVDLGEVRAALRRVVEDPNASGHARAEALRTARDLGAPASWLKAWQDLWGKAEFGVEGQLRRALKP